MMFVVYKNNMERVREAILVLFTGKFRSVCSSTYKHLPAALSLVCFVDISSFPEYDCSFTLNTSWFNTSYMGAHALHNIIFEAIFSK